MVGGLFVLQDHNMGEYHFSKDLENKATVKFYNTPPSQKYTINTQIEKKWHNLLYYLYSIHMHIKRIKLYQDKLTTLNSKFVDCK